MTIQQMQSDHRKEIGGPFMAGVRVLFQLLRLFHHNACVKNDERSEELWLRSVIRSI